MVNLPAGTPGTLKNDEVETKFKVNNKLINCLSGFVSTVAYDSASALVLRGPAVSSAGPNWPFARLGAQCGQPGAQFV